MGAKKNLVRERVGFINREHYKKFIAKYPESNVTYKEYISVLKESTMAIRDTILTHELGFKLPNNLGYIAVHKYKPSKRHVAIDWVNTRKYGKLIPFTNFHSMGYSYMIFFFKNRMIKPLYGYTMNAHRIIKRMLAKNIKENTQQYLTLEYAFFNKRFSINRVLNNDTD